MQTLLEQDRLHDLRFGCVHTDEDVLIYTSILLSTNEKIPYLRGNTDQNFESVTVLYG